VESDGASGHKKNVFMMITMTGFMNSHEINKIPVFTFYSAMLYMYPVFL
jgi:hypothetical protein